MLGVAGVLVQEIVKPDIFFYEAGLPQNLPEPFTNINMGGLLAFEFLMMHFVEVMSCPGGCSGGGGQPYNSDMGHVKKRIQRMHDADLKAETKYSHDNKSVAELYQEFLGRPLGEVSHHLLHRGYTDKSAKAAPGAAA